MVEVAEYCAFAATAACSRFFFLHVFRISLNSGISVGHTYRLTRWKPLFAVLLHRNVRVEVIQRSIRLFTSIPTTQIQSLNLVVASSGSLFGCWTTQGYKGEIGIIVSLVTVAIVSMRYRSRSVVVSKRHIVALVVVRRVWINLIHQCLCRWEGDTVGVDMTVRW